MAELEVSRNSTHVATACALFVRLVQENLPQDAFRELAGLPHESVPIWADRWHVNAPCIIELANIWCAGGWEEGWSVDSYRGPTIPPEWFDRLRQLNALPVDAVWLETGLEGIMSDGERREELGGFKTRPLTEDQDERMRYLGEELPALRRELLESDRALAPLAADPLRETEADFLNLARDHFRGRVSVGKGMGFTTVSSKPHLQEHMDWLISYQLRGESRDAIANRVHVVRQAVDRAVRELASLIGLQLRPSN